MVFFGIITGTLFPFFVMFLLNLPSSEVMTLKIYVMCICAGLLVGVINFYVYKHIIYDMLEIISNKLSSFRHKLNVHDHEAIINCSSDEYFIDSVTADPIIKDISNSFNEFIATIQKSIRSEMIKNKFLEELKNGLSAKDIADVVMNAFVKYFGGDGGCIIAYEHGEFNLIKSLHCVVNLDNIDQQELYAIMNENEYVSFDNLNSNSIRLNIVVGDYVPNSIVFLPLKYQQQNVGIAVLLARNAFSNAFDTIETNNFIKQATPFLYNSSLIRRLEVLAAVDELTGVLNRRFGMQRLQEEFSRAHRYASSLSVCMLDVDKFKKTNDTYGHQAGDEVLRRLAEHLREGLRVSDCVIRYGGEEFLVVLPGACLTDAYGIVDRIRRRVETCQLQYGSYAISYTFSGGICSYPSKGVTNPDDMVKLADDALYKAKNSGRNKIAAAEGIEMTSPGELVTLPVRGNA